MIGASSGGDPLLVRVKEREEKATSGTRMGSKGRSSDVMSGPSLAARREFLRLGIAWNQGKEYKRKFEIVKTRHWDG